VRKVRLCLVHPELRAPFLVIGCQLADARRARGVEDQLDGLGGALALLGQFVDLDAQVTLVVV